MPWRVAVDTGGTFTDYVGFEEEGRNLKTLKVSSHPENPSLSVMNTLEEAQTGAEYIIDLVHGTTVGTNAILEGKAPKVGLIVTEGFRDILEIRRLWREHLFGNDWNRPESLIPRKFCRGVRERINFKGEELFPLDERQLAEEIQALKSLGVHSYAVSFLFSFLNNSHEKRAKEIIHEIHPEARVSLSCEVIPEIREYERTSTTVINAQLMPVMGVYLESLQSKLVEARGSETKLRIMKSNGGIMPAHTASESAVQTLMSGPAGGMTASKFIGGIIDAKNIITFDMGGTSTDVGIIYKGVPQFVTEVDLKWNIPVRGYMMDIRSIGAGGGSIAWIDAGGALNVGPQSAGADPGPVCYGKGGTEPTVTDANLLLGRIAPDRFLGGRMKLDNESAKQALKEKIAKQYNWTEVQSAQGIYEISLSNMALLVREMTINRGYDPRDFTLMSFGGAGGLYAGQLARELGIRKVCIPIHAATFSAFGGLMSDFIYDYVQAYYVSVEEANLSRVNSICQDLMEQAEVYLKTDGITQKSIFQFSVDMRYVGESFELTVPLIFNHKVEFEDLLTSAERFHDLHKQLYSFDRPIEPVEIIGLRLKVIAAKAKPPLLEIDLEDAGDNALIEKRSVFFSDHDGFIETSIYSRDCLGAGIEISGPAIIEEDDTTIVIFSDQRAVVDSYGNLILEC